MDTSLPLDTPLARFRGELFRAWPSELGDDYNRLGKSLHVQSTPGVSGDPGVSSQGRDVHKSELDELFKLEITFQWHGANLRVNKFMDDGLMSASPVDRDARWAKENGLEVIDFAWSIGSFHPEEVENLTETKHDLLARWEERKR